MDALRRKLGLAPISRLLVTITRTRSPYFPRRPATFHFLRYSSSISAHPAPSLPLHAPPPIVLRDYQEECIQAVLSHLDQGHKRLGISLATGSGKTVVFTQLIGRIPPRDGGGDKTLIVVHRRELVEQAAQHCRRAYPDRTVAIEMGNYRAPASADIIIASIRSLTSQDRIARFDPALFKLILVDEAHHIVARSYLTTLEYFGLGDKQQQEREEDCPALVGVSATFSRADGLKLGAAIDHIVYHKDYMDMIDEKWLANAMFTTVRSEANLSRVRKDRFGDFALGSLSRAVNTSRSNEITVRAWLANAVPDGRKSTLVFCVDLAHTRELTAAFRAAGVDAHYITSQTPRDERDDQLRAFKAQEYPVLVNCGLFTEGTDIPNVDCVLLARPTRSRNLLIQMIGRGLRLHPGKKDCHIIDMVATLETGVLSTPTLFGLHPNEILDKITGEELKKKQDSPLDEDTGIVLQAPDSNEQTLDEDIRITFTKYDTMYDLLHDLKSEKHIRSMSRYAWVRAGGEHRYVLSDTSGWITIESESLPDGQKGPDWSVHHVMKFKSPTTEKVQYTRPRLIASAPDLEAAVHAADTFAAAEFDERYISTRQPWRHQLASRAQVDFLNKAKLREKSIGRGAITRGQAADMITKLKFGGKKRFETMKARRLRAEKPSEMEVLRRREMVRVGPVAR